jgi:hypothetical protein
MTIELFNFHIRGLSPLLMHNPASMLVVDENAGKATTRAKKIPPPDIEAEAAAYRNEDGTLYFPSIGCKRGTLLASTGKKIGKLAAARLVRAGLFEAEERIHLYHPETKEPLRNYEIFAASVVIMKARVIHHRPRLWPWAGTVMFEINDDFLAPEHVFDLLGQAGLLAGLGDWRPEKGGRYGRYEVINYERIEAMIQEAAE